MRILTVCVSTNVFGAEISTLRLLEGLARAGHRQLAVTSIWTDGEFNQRLQALGIPEVRLPFGFLSKRLGLRELWWTLQVVMRIPMLWLKWARLTAKFKPDVILFTTWRHVLLTYPLLGRRAAFLIEHSPPTPTRTRKVLYCLFVRRLTGFITVSQHMKTALRQIGVPEAQLHVVANGVCTVGELEYRELSGIHAFDGSAARIGIVGQIAPHKGHLNLLRAIAVLRQRGVAVRLKIYGDGSAEHINELKRTAEELGIVGNCEWCGYKRRPAEIYPTFDISVVPSRFEEPFGMVAAEAASFCRPVVASNRGGLPEVVEDGKTGLLFDPDDPADIAAKLGALILDQDQAAAMGREGSERVLRLFTHERMVAAYEDILSAAVHAKRGAGA
jgi:glycosyltransferase involved in cell wall biosynthesis